MNDRAVSEVIAFVLIFSIVITSVGLLYTAGFGSIDQIQEDETDRSAQRAFSASAVALQDIQRGQGEHRAFDVELSGRTMAVNESLNLSVYVDGSYEASATGGLVYGLGADTKIVYQSGAVIRSDGPDSQTVIRGPEFTCRDSHAVVSIVSIDGPSGAVSSDGSIEIRADGPLPGDETLLTATDSASKVSVEYDGTPYDDAWQRYFDDQGWDTVTDEKATCTVDDVAVRHVPIDLEFAGV